MCPLVLVLGDVVCLFVCDGVGDVAVVGVCVGVACCCGWWYVGCDM